MGAFERSMSFLEVAVLIEPLKEKKVKTMKNGSMHWYALFFAAVLPVMVCISCTKMLSEIIPPDEQRLIGLELKNVDRFVCSTSTDINDYAVTVTVPKGTDVTRLLPDAAVSPKATLFPVTLRYLQEAFPATDVLKLGSTVSTFENIETINKWFFDLYADNPDFNIPELVFPINFLSPVPFAVIGGQGNIELYTVKVLYDDGTDPATGLLPPGVPAEKNILSFSVGEPQIGESVIGANTVDFEVIAGTEVRALTVRAAVSPHAILIPLTKPYLLPLLTRLGMDPLSVLSGYMTAPNKEAYLRALFAPVNLSNVIVPLDKPIDFTNPVQFAVLGNDKDVKLYTVRCEQTVTGAVLKNFGFSKVKNPGLVKDGTVRIDRTAKTVTAELFYPVEYAHAWDDFLLDCDIAYVGDGAAIVYEDTRFNVTDKITFTAENPSGAQYHLGSAEAKIIISFGTEQTEYRLFISFKEDPDTSRSITDFRFTKDKNASIKTLSMAAIVNDGHEGTITATVLYTGSAKPESLIPTFITPGTVTVNGAVQTSGSSAQDFRKTLTYICTSRDGQYTRKYTVKIRFVYAEPAQSLLKTFRFPAGVNPLIGDSEGRIDQTAHTVHITAHYAGERPKKLIPEFSATGEVTVDGLTQSSGFSAQDFEYPVYYKVTDPDDPQTYTIYAVTVHFEYSADSGCELMEFQLLQQDNPSLTQDVTTFISAHSGVIYALLPRGADVTNLIPRFTAQGRVTVDGVEQTSGETAADFSSAVEYKVTSENGLHTKIYRVTLQQIGGIIYVDPKATGRRNGSTWEDAFTNFKDALQKANEIPAEVSAELWLSKDCKPVYRDYELKRTLTLRGGFIGIERDADERNKDNKSLFYHVLFYSQTPIGGTLIFDGIKFDNYYSSNNKKTLHNIQWDTACENALVIQNCTLAEDLDVSTSARLASVTVKDVSKANSYGKDITLPDCDTAAVDNFIGDRLYINKDGGIAPAQKAVVKNSTCWNSIYAKDISVSHSKGYGSFYNFDTISLSSITDDTSVINLSPVASASVEIEDCRLGSITIKNTQNGVLKLKKVNITGSTVKYVKAEPSVITERFFSWYNGTIGPLKLPACSVKMMNRGYFTGEVDVSCNAKDFKDIMEAVPVYTYIENVSAKTIKCGYVTGVTKEHFRTIKREYSCPPYVLKEGDWKKIYVEPVPFASGGSHTLKNVYAENLSVFSGDSITLKGGEGSEKFLLKGQLKGALSFACRWDEAQQLNVAYNACDYSSVVLNNETTSNSTIDIDNIYIDGEWFRARTKTLSVRKIQHNWNQLGCLELQGHNSVTVTDCNFRNLVPFYAYYDQKPTEIRPSFLAVGGTVSLTGCTFDESFVQVGSGTCFDTHLNSTFNCTAAVWKK